MMNEELRPNPFCDRGRWWWRDVDQIVRGPYATQVDALRGLVRYCDKRSRWVIFKDLLREFFRS